MSSDVFCSCMVRRFPKTCVRRGAVAPAVIALIALLAVAGAVWMIWFRGDRTSEESARERASEIFSVIKGSFDITVPASGELAAFNQIEIRNPIQGRAVITYIAPEGATVKRGEVLIRLADEEIRNSVKDAELNELTAQNAVTAAQKSLEIQISQNDSRLQQAQLKVELAELALEQWERGEVEAERQRLTLALEKAERELVRLTEKYEESAKLLEREFISKDEFKRDEIAKIEAEAQLLKAKLDREVYEQYQYKRDRKQKESDVQQAKDELERVRTQNEAELVKATDDLKTKEGQLEIRRSRLADLRKQLEGCVTVAPADGLVVYASSLETGGGMRGNNTSPPQVGTELRPNELVIILPDVSQMIAAVMVHESLAGRIKPGQQATVVPDSAQSTTLSGRVYNVGVLAQSGGWRDPNRRDYTVRIALENAGSLGLKPSMRCKAEIFLDRVTDAQFVPIQAVFRETGRTSVYVAQGSGFVQKEVRIGRTSEIYAEVVEGLSLGDRVLLREPRATEIIAKLPPVPPMAAMNNGDAANGPMSGGVTPPTTPLAGGGSAPGANGGESPGARPGGTINLMAQFDADGDGKLQKSELPAQMQGMFERLDANSDGAIDESEIAAMRNRAGSGGGRPGASEPRGPGNNATRGEQPGSSP